MNRVAMVTMVIGEKYKALWQQFCRKGMEAYAQKYGFDFFVLDQPIDKGPLGQRSFAWQKLLLGSVDGLRAYDWLIWIDSDIVVNTALAPNILLGIPEDRVGAVRYHPLLSQPLFLQAHRRICGGLLPDEFNSNIFQQHGLDADPKFLLNTGVLVVPRSALRVLETTYRKYPKVINPQQEEQAVLSYELFINRLTFLIDEKFNACWYEYKYGIYFGDDAPPFANKYLVNSIFHDVYFFHFAADKKDMALLDIQNTAS